MHPDLGRRRWLTGGTALAFAILCGRGAYAAAEESTPGFIAKLIPDAHLQGEGRFRKYMIHLYDARLYVGAGGFRQDDPKAMPFALDLEYARHLKGKLIAKVTLDEFERFDAGTPQLRAHWYEELQKLLPDVDEGQHLTGFFLPDFGLRLYSNGVEVGAVDDVEFARWFFAIWLDPRTQDPDLRRSLLSGGRLAS